MPFQENDFAFLENSKKTDNEQIRQALTYWADTWRRLKKNKMAIAGLIGVILITLFAFVGPLFTLYDYDEQQTDFANTPLRVEVFEIADDLYVYLTPAYRLIVVEPKTARSSIVSTRPRSTSSTSSSTTIITAKTSMVDYLLQTARRTRAEDIDYSDRFPRRRVQNRP
ncbi:MAG: hypothetical protein M0C28_18310 [Candidatus Moduliflexus flocculans]|nr:hypothetical protein [Candidatus Moduliflexus flocculans]